MNPIGPAPSSRSLALLAALMAAACTRTPQVAVPVTCMEIHAPGGPPPPAPEPGAPAGGLAPPLAVSPDDVLELVVVLDSVPPGPGTVRVRVDALADPGIVNFFMPPPTAGAAGMALAPPATFQGCASVAPVGFELRAPVAPRAKAWVRVSSDRPVRVRPRVAGRGSQAPLVITPGTSGIVGWEG
jgi:hypothetical protein